MLCAICRRDARGFGFAPALIRVEGPSVKLCSRRCQDLVARWKGMIDPNKHEKAALAAAAVTGGEYVEAIGKTDLATWTGPEWATLVEAIVTAFQDSLRAAYADDPPL